MPHQHTSRTVQETQLIGPEVHLGANCALSSLKLKFCWDSEYQYEPPFPWRLTHFGWGHLGTFGDRASLLYTDHKGDKGQHKGHCPVAMAAPAPTAGFGQESTYPCHTCFQGTPLSVLGDTSSANPLHFRQAQGAEDQQPHPPICEPWQAPKCLGIKHSRKTPSCAVLLTGRESDAWG